MIFTASTAAILASALFGGANAHMIMSQPTPFNAAKVSTSPLGSANGLTFPCQGPTDNTPPTAAKAGETIPVQFTGAATHGGGTCQFSVTYENPPPSDPSKWKVLHTVVGGCPSSSKENLPVNGQDTNSRPTSKQCDPGQSGECLSTFNVPISNEVKNGKAIFAWTWFNKIGNREMYMNCAPIEITGGKDDDSGMADLPSLFMANIDSKPCTTKEQVLDLSTVGGSVEVLVQASPDSLGTCSITGGGGDAGNAITPTIPEGQSPAQPSAPAVAPSTPPSPPPPSTPSAPPTQSPPENNGGQFAQNPATPLPSQAATPADQVPCGAGEGAFVCFSETSFGQCFQGSATPMSTSAGLICVNGNPQTPAPARKRHMHRHLRPHARSFI